MKPFFHFQTFSKLFLLTLVLFSCKDDNVHFEFIHVTNEDVNIREKPVLSAKVIANVGLNKQLQATGKKTTKTDEILIGFYLKSEFWYEVKIDGKIGWVYGGLTNKQKKYKNILVGQFYFYCGAKYVDACDDPAYNFYFLNEDHVIVKKNQTMPMGIYRDGYRVARYSFVTSKNIIKLDYEDRGIFIDENFQNSDFYLEAESDRKDDYDWNWDDEIPYLFIKSRIVFQRGNSKKDSIYYECYNSRENEKSEDLKFINDIVIPNLMQ
jgi:Bacterial SH3 domain